MTLSGCSANLVAINACAKSQKDADTEGARMKIDFDALYLASRQAWHPCCVRLCVWGACVLFTCQVCVCGVVVGSIAS